MGCQGVYPFDKIYAKELISKTFSRSSEVYSSYVFLHRLFDVVRFQFSQVIVISFSWRVLTLSLFGSCIPSGISLFPLVMITVAQTLFLIVWIRCSGSFSCLANILISFMYMILLIFSCNFVNLQSPVHFLSTLLNGVIAIKNSSYKSKSLYNISLCFCFFIYARVFLPLLILPSSFHFVGYFVHFQILLSKFVGPYHRDSFYQPIALLQFSALLWLLWRCAGPYIIGHLFLFFCIQYPFCSSGNSLWHTSDW